MSIKSVGILIKSLDTSQKCMSLCLSINSILDDTYNISPIVFYQELGKSVVLPRCCQLQQGHAWGFDGILISTDIQTTSVLSQCLRAKKKLFYVYDLEWFYHKNIHYNTLSQVYQNPEIDLIARTSQHFDILKKCWKTPIGVLNDYDYTEFTEIICRI